MRNYLKILLAIFIAGIIWSATKPLSKEDWFLEMLPVILALPVLFYLGKKYKISNFSYTLIFLYLDMLVIQAHLVMYRLVLN
jgi:putative membrane protein